MEFWTTYTLHTGQQIHPMTAQVTEDTCMFFFFSPLKVLISNPAFDRTKRWVISANKAGKTTHIITGEV